MFRFIVSNIADHINDHEAVYQGAYWINFGDFQIIKLVKSIIWDSYGSQIVPTMWFKYNDLSTYQIDEAIPK